jgi:cyclohexadieny/prephenate dehydrogenase
MQKGPVFERITIIGLGLIGSSIARGVREYQLADLIVGCDENSAALNIARAQKMIDFAIADPKTAVAESQLVILAVPPSALQEIAQQIAPGLARGAIVMDTASVKQPAMQAIGASIPSYVDFVPAHPIAGSEQSGIGAGNADLFVKKRIIVTPNEPLAGNVLQKVNSFWKGLGARVEGMPPQLHDHLYAHVSHLPQLLAYGAIGLVPAITDDARLARFTRLGNSSPSLWTEIFLLNKAHVLAALGRYMDVLAHVTQELKDAPPEAASNTASLHIAALLFARIAASCLVSTVMEAEKKNGVAFARFAGSGFDDFTAPAQSPPEGDIETISGHHEAVIALLQPYLERLHALRTLIAKGDGEALQSSLVSSARAA